MNLISESLREREQQCLTQALMRLNEDKQTLVDKESKITTREDKLK